MTKEQRSVVDTLCGDLSVSAGAGSGKTTVLAHRFAHALKSGEGWQAASMDGILTMTFTNKAAAEIAERVRKVVSTTISPDAAREIDRAWISTIHAFCARLVRRHALEAGVDPYFVTADEVTAQALQTKAFDQALEALFATGLPAAETTLETYGLEGLRSMVVKATNQVRSMGLDPSVLVIPRAAESLAPLVRRACVRARVLHEALASEKQTDAVVKDQERLGEYVLAMSKSDVGPGDGVERLLQLEDGLRISCRAAKVERQDFAAARDDLRAALRTIEQSGTLEVMEWLIREYARQYALVKQERALLDFEDLQELAVILLETQPHIARRYKEQFKLVMVDEFQDTNGLQMRVIEPLRSDNLCVVGDIRQSIYGWRYADVDIFRTLSAEMAQEQLSNNFRSHPEILGFVNSLFSEPHLFGSEFMRLKPKDVDSEEPAEVRVECLFVDKEESDRAESLQAEARWVARNISSLVHQGCNGSDIAILLRSSGGASEFARALEDEGIAAVVSAGQNLFDAVEVLEIKALLRAIAVPLDDAALLSVLTGRLVALSDEALLAIRRASETNLWTGLRRVALGESETSLSIADFDALRHAHDTLDRFYTQHGRRSLSNLIIEACEAFDYDLTLHSLGAGGVRAWANVLKLAHLAEGYEMAEGNDVAAFVAHLQERGRLGVDRPAAADLGDGAVRIMTVHSSKGLEFPVVFVADLGTTKEKATASILISAEEEQGEQVPVAGLRLPTALGDARTVLYQALAPEQGLRELEEQKRVLYVACTRAKERLFVSGATRLGREAEEEPGLLDWIRQAIPDSTEDEPDEVEGRRVVNWNGNSVGISILAPMGGEERQPDASSGPRCEPLFAEIPLEEPIKHLSAKPESLSFSSIDLFRKCPLSFHAKYELGLKAMDLSLTPHATMLGSATHDALQALQLGLWSEDKAAQLARRYALDDEHVRRVVSSVEAFSSSELAARLAAADRVSTECPLLYPLGDMVLTGSLDVIAWSGERALIVDYKTGKAPDEAPEREASHDLQASCYAVASLAAGSEQVEVVFAFVEAGMQLKSYHYTADDLKTIDARLRGYVDLIEAEERGHLASYDQWLCRSCPALGGVCPVSASRS